MDPICKSFFEQISGFVKGNCGRILHTLDGIDGNEADDKIIAVLTHEKKYEQAKY